MYLEQKLKNQYRYYVGDTKGWVRVEKEKFEKTGLLNSVSSSSYHDEEFIYLDEDLDFSSFVYFVGYMPDLDKVHVNDDYFNNLEQYNGGIQ